MLEPLFLVLVAGGALVSHLVVRTRRDARLVRAWREAARLGALTDISVESGPLRINARSGARRVSFTDTYRRKGDRSRGALVVRGGFGIRLRAETWETALEKAMGIRELQLGDEAFDRDIHVQGPPEVLRAVLDAPTRIVVRELVLGWQVSVRDGELTIPLPHGVVERPSTLASLLKDILDLASRLDRPEDLALRIAENTRREGESRVRLENLVLLLEQFPQHFATRETLERALRDANPEVRIRAAVASKADGVPTLMEMATLPSVEDDYAARAILALGDAFPPPAAIEVLGRTLRGRQIQTAMACLDRLGRAGDAPTVALLAKVLAVEDGPLGVAAARALGASGAQAAEAPLVQALARSRADVAASAAEALGLVGSTDAVLPLKEAAAREDTTSRLQRAVRQSVAEIQARIHGASPGQLSVVDAEAGQLSLAVDDGAGHVSLADRGTR
jgi:hypothetical protein